MGAFGAGMHGIHDGMPGTPSPRKELEKTHNETNSTTTAFIPAPVTTTPEKTTTTDEIQSNAFSDCRPKNDDGDSRGAVGQSHGAEKQRRLK